MTQGPRPDRGREDGEEQPGSSPPPAGAGSPGQAAPGQPGGDSPVPRRPAQAAGFADGGPADVLAPGPGLAGLLHAVTGGDGTALTALTDTEVLGVIAAGRRMASWAAWAETAALAEFGRRRAAAGEPSGISRGAADEVGWKTRMSWQSAGARMARACAAAERLPGTLAALRQGRIDPGYVIVIADYTSVLSAQDAAEADRLLAGAAAHQTYGELRAAAARLVMRLDPDAVRRRKEQAAKRDAHVRLFREDSGNAAMMARELPATEALASWQHVQQRALDLRAAGVTGSLRELRVLAMMDLLQERDSRAGLGTGQQAGEPGPGQAGPGPGADEQAGPGPGADEQAGPGPGGDEQAGPGPGGDEDGWPGDAGDHRPGGDDLGPDADPDLRAGGTDRGPDAGPDLGPGDGPCDGGPEDGGAGPDGRGPGGPGGPGGAGGPGGPGGPGGTSGPGRGGPGGSGDRRPGPPPGGGASGDQNRTRTGQDRRGGRTSLAAQPVIVIPWEALTGGPSDPAGIPGFGMTDPQTARDLLAAACRNPHTRICVTILGPDGTARLHGCAPGRPDPGIFPADRTHRPPGPGSPRPPGPGRTGTPSGGTDDAAADLIRQLRVTLAPISRDSCEHAAAEPGYHPSRRLAHLVRARNMTCAAPGCGAAAAACDLDHTQAWDKGGITCECGLAPLCRHHHQVKQSDGWRLTQPQPGVLLWRTPARLEYTTKPTSYPTAHSARSPLEPGS
jgi:Domain of unknown function (DUF222)